MAQDSKTIRTVINDIDTKLDYFKSLRDYAEKEVVGLSKTRAMLMRTCEESNEL